MRGLEPHRDFERRPIASARMPRERGDQPIDARADQRRMRLDDDPRQPGQRHGDAS